jgi:hypothetical protein
MKMKVTNSELENYEAIIAMVDELDVDKIVAVMQHLDWRWNTKDEYGNMVLMVPSNKQIVVTARDLLKRAVEGACKRQRLLQTKHEMSLAATGGIEAEVIAYDDDVVVATIRFVLEQVDNAHEADV